MAQPDCTDQNASADANFHPARRWQFVAHQRFVNVTAHFPAYIGRVISLTYSFRPSKTAHLPLPSKAIRCELRVRPPAGLEGVPTATLAPQAEFHYIYMIRH
eukprot:SAG11_NODE_2699_length_3077_cov_2.064473_3_plen_102_part_00